MIKLKKEFDKKGLGIHFQQVFNDGEVVIYELSQKHQSDEGCSHWFELFEYRTAKADIYHSDEYEVYPWDEAFGVWAWSCSDKKCIEKVMKKHFPNYNEDKVASIIAVLP